MKAEQETVYSVSPAADYIGDIKSLQKFIGFTYYQTYGGGPEGGYFYNGATVYAVSRGWGTPFKARKLKGGLLYQKGEYTGSIVRTR
jgi:hypothetical protein